MYLWITVLSVSRCPLVLGVPEARGFDVHVARSLPSLLGGDARNAPRVFQGTDPEHRRGRRIQQRRQGRKWQVCGDGVDYAMVHHLMIFTPKTMRGVVPFDF